jgi:hypothetical protein
MRLLSRRVNIRCLAGPKKLNTFFGKVEHPKGDISAEILKARAGLRLRQRCLPVNVRLQSLLQGVRRSSTCSLRFRGTRFVNLVNV